MSKFPTKTSKCGMCQTFRTNLAAWFPAERMHVKIQDFSKFPDPEASRQARYSVRNCSKQSWAESLWAELAHTAQSWQSWNPNLQTLPGSTAIKGHQGFPRICLASSSASSAGCIQVWSWSWGLRRPWLNHETSAVRESISLMNREQATKPHLRGWGTCKSSCRVSIAG